MTNFLSMGGYALYVWPAYAVALSGLAAIVMRSLVTLHARRRELAATAGEE